MTTVSELRTRVTAQSAVAVTVLAGLAVWVAGAPAGVGIAAAGTLTIANFWWLARGVGSAAGTPDRARALLTVAAGARFVTLLGAFALVLVSGWAHPVAVVAGLSVVPCALIVVGLRTAR